jgi:entericidin B
MPTVLGTIAALRSPKEKSRIRETTMRKNLVAILLSIVLVSGAASLLSACNTTAGAGEDLSATGHAITNSAEKNK